MEYPTSARLQLHNAIVGAIKANRLLKKKRKSSFFGTFYGYFSRTTKDDQYITFAIFSAQVAPLFDIKTGGSYVQMYTMMSTKFQQCVFSSV